MEPARSPSSRGLARPSYPHHETCSNDAAFREMDQSINRSGESDDEDEDIDDEDLAPLEYAQRYGLIVSSLDINPFQSVDALPSEDELLADLNGPYWSSGNIQEEKLNVDKDTAQFLASVFDLGEEPAFIEFLNTTVGLNHLKIEEAVLASDPQLECMRLKLRNMATICATGLQPFEVNDERGEGFTWTPVEVRAVADVNELVANEKLEVDAEAMQRIRLAMEASGLEWEEMTDLARKEEVAHQILPTPITPPLMPLSPPESPQTLSGPAGELQFTSTPEDLCAIEAADLEMNLLHNDKSREYDPTGIEPIFPIVDADPLSLPWMSEWLKSSPVRKEGLSSLRLDTPLTSTDETEHPWEEVVKSSFPADLQAEESTSDTDFEQALNKFMDEVLEPAALSANKQIETEELSDINTILRIDVPIISLDDVTPPWKQSNSNPILQHTKADLVEGDERWSGLSKVERALSWTPFPSRLGSIQSEELFDDASLAQYMSMLAVDGDINIESLLCTPDTLCILEACDSDDDELEHIGINPPPELDQAEQPLVLVAASPTQHASKMAQPVQSTSTKMDVETPMDMQTLLRKRKLELDSSVQDEPRLKQHVTSATESRSGCTTRLSTTFGGTSVSGLSAFMHLQGRSVKPCREMEDRPEAPIAQVSHSAGVPEIGNKQHGDTGGTREPVTDTELPLSKEPASVIVSSVLLKNRHLVRQMQKTLPNIDLVERGALHPTSPSGACQDEIAEADITISPETGVILTTLQKVKQKPLPGQRSFFGIRERIAATSHRYERLIVLISETRSSESDAAGIIALLDQSDTAALSDLIGFASRLDSSVEVYYVPGGGDALVRWIAAAISRYSVPEGRVKLLQEETLWERLLRSAGFNAFAAQGVLSQVKVPDGIANGRQAGGLARFIAMSAAERKKCFAPVLGGERVLQRVNDVIANGWYSK